MMLEVIQPDRMGLPLDALGLQEEAGSFAGIDAAPPGPLEPGHDQIPEAPSDPNEARQLPATLSAIVAVGAFAAVYTIHGLVCGHKKVDDAEARVKAANNLPKDTPGRTQKIIDALHGYADATIEAERAAADRKNQAPNN